MNWSPLVVSCGTEAWKQEGWQYLAKQSRSSPSDAGFPLNPGHWQFGYVPIFRHISSQTTPNAANLSCICFRIFASASSHASDLASLNAASMLLGKETRSTVNAVRNCIALLLRKCCSKTLTLES